MGADDRYERGLAIRREVVGEEYVDRTLADADAFNADFQRLVTEYCWGASWGREGLSRGQRSLNNLCLLAAQGRDEEFALHFRGALRNGCSLDELRETLIQITIYAGVPAGISAFRIARRVLAEEGVEVGPAEGGAAPG